MDGRLEEIMNAQVGGVSLETFMCDLLAEAEKKNLDVEKLNLQVRLIKQINNRHHYINETLMYELKEQQLQLDKLKYNDNNEKNTDLRQ